MNTCRPHFTAPQSAFLAALRRLFAPGVGLGTALLTEASIAELFHVEQLAVASAIDRRQQEFAAGRLAAYRAQRALGLQHRPVPMGADRAPVWPDGLRGTISHHGGLAAAAVSNHTDIRALGLDIEPDEPLPGEIVDTVLLPEERAWLSDMAEPGKAARAIFCIKEAVYKAQYPLTGQIIGFDAVKIEFEQGQGRFAAVFQQDCSPFCRGERLHGHCTRAAGLILSGLTISA